MADVEVEVVDLDEAGQLSGERTFKDLANRADDLGASLSQVASGLRAQLVERLAERQDTWGVQEVGLEFSLDLKAEGGAIIARASAQAGFRVTMNLRRLDARSN